MIRASHRRPRLPLAAWVCLTASLCMAAPVKPATRGQANAGLPLVQFLEELNLPPDQRQEIGNILAGYGPELRAHIAALLQARREVFEAIHTEPTDEYTIRMACVRASVADTNLALLRSRMAADLRAVLTPEQQALLKEGGSLIFDRIETGIGRWFDFVRSLIAS